MKIRNRDNFFEKPSLIYTFCNYSAGHNMSNIRQQNEQVTILRCPTFSNNCTQQSCSRLYYANNPYSVSGDIYILFNSIRLLLRKMLITICIRFRKTKFSCRIFNTNINNPMITSEFYWVPSWRHALSISYSFYIRQIIVFFSLKRWISLKKTIQFSGRMLVHS